MKKTNVILPVIGLVVFLVIIILVVLKSKAPAPTAKPLAASTGSSLLGSLISSITGGKATPAPVNDPAMFNYTGVPLANDDTIDPETGVSYTIENDLNPDDYGPSAPTGNSDNLAGDGGDEDSDIA